jgi:hypothetical protein
MSKSLRIVLIYLGLVVVVSQAFPLLIYQALLPAEFFMFRRGASTGMGRFALVMLFTWVVPAVLVAVSMWLGRRYDWRGANSRLLVVATAIYLAIWGMRLLAATVPGGGGLYVLDSFLGYVALPLRMALFAGAVLFLLRLGKTPAAGGCSVTARGH